MSRLEILQAILKLHTDRIGYSTRKYWHGPNGVTYSSTRLGSILTVFGDDGSKYAFHVVSAASKAFNESK